MIINNKSVEGITFCIAQLGPYSEVLITREQVEYLPNQIK